MQTSFFVVSDWHLGGAPPDDNSPGFQMCTASGRKRLAEFIRWTAGQRTRELDVNLVVNGDIVDFLAEEEFSSFTRQDSSALVKFKRIVERTKEVWDALHDLVQSGAALTLLLGNHDLELSLPGPRRALLDRLGPGRVEFVYDNQALTLGPVLIEHGNRYDAWNVVSHDVLRQVRSALSRGEAPPEFPRIPGSELVTRVMNRFKAKYAFLDLLKPETEAALPLLAALEPTALRDLSQVVGLFMQSRRTRFDAQGRPVDRGAISAQTGATSPEEVEAQEALALAREVAGVKDGGAISSGDTAMGFLEAWRAGKIPNKEQRLTHLYRSLRFLAEKQHRPFHVNQETDTYLRHAKDAAGRGFKVVLFGHTHSPKRVALDNGALYLNTGTWADLMRLPEGVFDKDGATAREELGRFVEGLASNQIDTWREQFPTFARIDMDARGRTETADLLLFRGENQVDRLPDGLLARA